jgi:hypothetical protein
VRRTARIDQQIAMHVDAEARAMIEAYDPTAILKL